MPAEKASPSRLKLRSVTRPRTSYSCHACRARRVKCDRVHPQCSRCCQDQVPCVYDQPPSRDKQEKSMRRQRKRKSANETVEQEQSSQEPSKDSLPKTEIPDAKSETVPGLGYLSVQRGGRSRYVGHTFWAFVEENNNDLDMLLQDQDRYSSPSHGSWPFQAVCSTCQHGVRENGTLPSTASGSFPTPSLNSSFRRGPSAERRAGSQSALPAGQYSTALPGLLQYLPPREACDVLYRSFVTSIHSFLPLIHLPSFDQEYHRFWTWIEARDEPGHPRGILAENPSFLPLLFAVLLGGAVSCSSSDLKSQFKNTPRLTICSLLSEACSHTQNLVAFPRNPTIYSLTSFLITQNLLVREEEPLAACSYISVALRVAQAMGLHRDGSLFGLDPIETEMRRRIWWHIIHTDIMTAIPSALPPSCLSDTIYDTKMMSEIKDEYIVKFAESKLQTGDEPSPPPDQMLDVRFMVAVNRYSITSMLRRILRRQFDTTPLTRADFQGLKEEVDALDTHINGRIEQLWNVCSRARPDSGSETDFIEHTFVEWAQLLLRLMVHKAYCALYQPLVRNPGHPMWTRVRSDCIHHCQKFIENFYDMCTLQHFRPYHWLYPGLYQPLHAAVVLLSDLHRAPQSPETDHSMALIDRLFSLITPNSGVVSEDDGVITERNLSEGGREAWVLLRRLRRKAWEKVGRDPDVFWTDPTPASLPSVTGSAYLAAEDTPPSCPSTIPPIQTPFNQNIEVALDSDLLAEPLEYWDYLAGSDPFQFNWMTCDMTQGPISGFSTQLQ